MAANEHLLYLTMEAEGSGVYGPRVICPDEHLGDKRPCAVWATEDEGGGRLNECTFQQYAKECADLEEWLFGTFEVGPIRIRERSGGFEWSAEIVEGK